MRLVCPNCGAQYEVDDRVIPDGGRDVQCSACGHAWYQMPPHSEGVAEPEPEPDAIAGADDDAETEDEIETVADELPEAATEGETAAETDVGQMIAATVEEPDVAKAEDAGADDHGIAPGIAPDVAPEIGPEREPEAELEADIAAAGPEVDEDANEDEDVAATGDEAEAPPRRALDDDLRAILQEEAEREMQARAADRSHEPEAMETQPDLGLEAGSAPEDERRRLARARTAEFQADDEDDTPEIDAALAAGGAAVAGAAGLAASVASGDGETRQPRRDLFPDIEEINSTLDGYGPDERADEDEYETRARGGFGRAFLAVLVLVVLAVVLYVFAPRLAEAVPALEPALSAYVGLINDLRNGLAATVEGLFRTVDGTEGG